MKKTTIKSVIFDLDGTLLDTEPDFTFAMNQLLNARRKPKLKPGALSTTAAYGSKEMIKRAFDINEDEPEFTDLQKQFLVIYSENIAQFTKPIAGIPEVLRQLADRHIPWGIVTNKPGWLTTRLLQQIPFFHPPSCVVSGDTLAKRKPHPDPLFYACKLLNCSPHECVYIGDTDIDIAAANNAHMPILVAQYGYLGLSHSDLEVAGFIRHPAEIIEWMDKQG